MPTRTAKDTTSGNHAARRPAQGGYALFIVLIFASCLFVVWAGLFSYAKAARKWGDTAELRRQATWAARAGLVHRAAQLAAGRRWPVARPPLGGMKYRVSERSDGGDLIVTSTATSGGYTAVVEWRIAGGG